MGTQHSMHNAKSQEKVQARCSLGDAVLLMSFGRVCLPFSCPAWGQRTLQAPSWRSQQPQLAASLCAWHHALTACPPRTANNMPMLMHYLAASACCLAPDVCSTSWLAASQGVGSTCCGDDTRMRGQIQSCAKVWNIVSSPACIWKHGLHNEHHCYMFAMMPELVSEPLVRTKHEARECADLHSTEATSTPSMQCVVQLESKLLKGIQLR